MTVQVTALDHVNFRAPREMFERLRAFYRDVLGLHEGERPAFGTPGAWMYAGGRPVVHLSVAGAGEPARAEGRAAGTIDHVAFLAVDPEAAAANLRRHGIEFRASRSEITRQHQYFFTDPAGNGVELNFPFID
jgi:catechol 2,3-dioxygenase-like lactoylglutathione lyase family enzyme